MKKRKLFPSLSISFSLSLVHSLSSFILFSLSSSLSLSNMTFSTLSLTQTLPLLHIITTSKDKRERETYIILKLKRQYIKLSLSLISRPSLPPSSHSFSPLSIQLKIPFCHKHLQRCLSEGDRPLSQRLLPSQRTTAPSHHPCSLLSHTFFDEILNKNA